jgi:hypothetical protein
MATAMDLILAAYATSAKNRAGAIASEAPELLPVLERSLRSLFADAVTHNRVAFAERIAVQRGGDPVRWPIPQDAESVVHIQKADGTTVAEVPHDDMLSNQFVPSVYRLGGAFYPAGVEEGPDDEPLWLTCSMMPQPLPGLESEIDPRLPGRFHRIPILELARYIAVKMGGRESEVAAFEGELAREYERYVAWLKNLTTTLGRRWDHAGRIGTHGTNPIA